MNRQEAQAKAKELGHCLCHLKITCPCNYFEKYDSCKCCGEPADFNEWLNENMESVNKEVRILE